MLLNIGTFKNYISGPQNFELSINCSAISKRLPTAAFEYEKLLKNHESG